MSLAAILVLFNINFYVNLLNTGEEVCLLDYTLIVTGTAVASSLMDKQGRKSLLITSFTGMVI